LVIAVLMTLGKVPGRSGTLQTAGSGARPFGHPTDY